MEKKPKTFRLFAAAALHLIEVAEESAERL